MDETMRILVLADARAVHTRRFIDGIRNAGCGAALVSLEEGGEIDFNLKRRTGISGIDYTLASLQLKNIIKEYKPDLINPHYASGYGYIAALGGTRKLPVVIHCLGSDLLLDPNKSYLQKKRVQYVLGKYHDLAVDSKYLGETARELCPKVNYEVIFWGADESAFELFGRRNIPDKGYEEPLRVLVPRPHKAVYNNRFIINALKELIVSKRIRITFPDWGDDIEEFKTMTERECPGGGVSYYSFQTRESFNRMLADYDVFLSASTSDSSPASLIEAMAAGLYPVAADIPGVREWLGQEKGGLFDESDPKYLNELFEKLLQGRADLREVLIANNDRAKRRGRFKENIRETIAYFERVLSRG